MILWLILIGVFSAVGTAALFTAIVMLMIGEAGDRDFFDMVARAVICLLATAICLFVDGFSRHGLIVAGTASISVILTSLVVVFVSWRGAR